MRYRKLSDLQRDVETFSGSWELSPEHELVYKERRRQTMDHRLQTAATENPPAEKQASFKASIVSAEPDALVVSVTVQEDEKRITTGLVKLSGKWELDSKNRITFSVKRGLDRYDKLTFQGAWEINDNFQVTYAFSTQQVLEGKGKKRRRVTKVLQELVFEGEWDISDKHCLTYLIGVDSESSFRFRGTFETSSILAKKGEIRYQAVPTPINWSEAEIGAALATIKKKKTKASAGIEYKTSRGVKKRLTQTITFFGKWKLSDDLALSFELERADGRRSEIKVVPILSNCSEAEIGATLTTVRKKKIKVSVGADMNLKKLQGSGIRRLLPDEISVDLTSKEGDPLGVEVVLTKDLFDGNARTFIRFRESLKETAVEAGVRIPW